MSDTVIKIENLSKQYRLGTVGTGTLSHDLNRWWARVRGKNDPTLAVTESNDRTHSGNSDYVWALKDINLEVMQGDILGIIGRNGAGKSTLLKILSRVTAPTTGSIKVKGRIASLLEVGTGFHPELTGRENIYLNGAILGMTRKEVTDKLDEIVDFSGCERFIDTPVKRYSSGMTVRLGFAVAAHLEPEILVVDEVLAVGDAEFQKKCIGKMGDVAKSGRTVLFVSHNMQAISTLTSTCVLLQGGTLTQAGSTQAVISFYLNAAGQTGGYRNDSECTQPCIRWADISTSHPGYVHRHGEPLTLSFKIQIPDEVNGTAFSFQIVDELDHPIIHDWYLAGDDQFMHGQPGTYNLTCTIPKLRLYMGNYRLVCYLTEKSGGKRFERLEDLCNFKVTMQGFSRNFNWTPGTCYYLEESSWKIQLSEN